MKVVHVIDSIGVGGGAEKIVTDTINAMDGVSHTLITLYTYPREYAVPHSVKRISLNGVSFLSLPAALFRLHRILKSEGADIVHAHLFWSALLCKLIRPGGVKLVVSVHSMWGIEIFRQNPLLAWLERRLAHRQQALVAVSTVALQNYLGYIPFTGPTYSVHNFVPEAFFVNELRQTETFQGPFRCVAVGHFKPAKDYFYLLQCFFLMRNQPHSLDLYGEGPLEKEMQEFINDHKLTNVRLRGVQADMHTVLPQYDLFLSASSHEGYGLALAEAMATGLPCLVSNIPAHREVGGDACLYFDKTDGSLRQALERLVEEPATAAMLAQKGRERAREVAGKEKCLNAVKHIYESLL